MADLTYVHTTKTKQMRCTVTATGINFRVAFQLKLQINIPVSAQVLLPES